MRTKGRSGRPLLALTMLLTLAAGLLLLGGSAVPAAAQSQASSTPITADFRFNDRHTTPFGPAYADIWLKQANFLACKPPLKQRFTYALCFFSGPAVGTPVPAGGGTAINPPLPCVLSKDGKSADCTCYGLSTEQYPAPIPYFIDINAILNLDLYWRTIRACGHDGSLCSARAPVRGDHPWNEAPVCRAANRDAVIPGAPLISVFSPVKNADYATGADPNTTSCSAAKYAGCMTAPCVHTGKYDAAGNELVQCKCPVFDGPYELSQAGVPCDANALTPPTSATTGRTPVYVWSSAHNPKKNHGPIDPPAAGCIPDLAGGKGCPLYSATTDYPITKGSPLCRKVCAAYRTGVHQSTPSGKGIQVAYSCDAALCTTMGIGQTTTRPPAPIRTAGLLRQACGGLDHQSGLRAILALEQANNCSCCASQVCGCDQPGRDIDAATQTLIGELNARQEKLGITPQCEINGTLCGKPSLAR